MSQSSANVTRPIATTRSQGTTANVTQPIATTISIMVLHALRHGEFNHAVKHVRRLAGSQHGEFGFRFQA